MNTLENSKVKSEINRMLNWNVSSVKNMHIFLGTKFFCSYTQSHRFPNSAGPRKTGGPVSTEPRRNHPQHHAHCFFPAVPCGIEDNGRYVHKPL